MTEPKPLDEAFPKPPDDATEPCRRYFRDHLQIVSFVGFVSYIAKDKTAIAELRRHAQLLLQMSYSRAVDNYLAYLSELLWLLYSEKPETLRARVDDGRGGTSTESVSLDVVLEHSTMDDLVATLVERRVTDLSFKGVRSLADYLGSRLKFDLYSDEEQFHRAMAIVELRNLIVHNRAVVNRLYLTRVPDSTYTLGQEVTLDVDDFFADLEFLAESVVDIDRRAVEKWSLATVSGPLEQGESEEHPGSSDEQRQEG